jgi:S1-C subfamily serine protease
MSWRYIALSLAVTAAAIGGGQAADVTAIVQKAKSAVVQIVVFDSDKTVSKTGTGFFFSSDGQLVTNFHVVSGASNLLAKTNTGAVFFLEKVLFTAPEQDLAILKFLVTEVPYLKLGDSSNAVEGQRVLVIGNPEGLEGTVSDGIISAFRNNRSYIQITAPVSQGSSGSPVLDESGQVIGIATLSRVEGQNLNLAIAVETLKSVLTGNASATAKPLATARENTPSTLAEFVKGFVVAGTSGNSGLEASFYADQVDYFDNGKVTKSFIEQDIEKYNQRWPQRKYWIDGEPTIQIVSSSHDIAEAVVVIGFVVQNRQQMISGTCQDEILITGSSTDPKIAFVRTKMLTRRVNKLGR